MRALPIAKLKALIYRSKGLGKPVRAKIEVEHNKYFSFSKAYYWYIPQIFGYYYYNNLQIGRAT